jgi:hypothetical protein
MKTVDGIKDFYTKTMSFFKNAKTCVDATSEGIIII